jgi:hypothetical protein
VRWIKKGVIFRVDGNYEWMAHHACVPVADRIDDTRLRIYFGPRDTQGRSHTTFLETDADDPSKVLYVHDRPLLSPGPLGAFDDSGVMPSCIVDHEGRKYLYYIGWNRGVTVPYRNSVGLAVSDDGGITFQRVFPGPVLDRTRDEPFFCASPFVMIDEGIWKAWYASATGWVVVDGHPEPVYVIKYAESRDGRVWDRTNITCIEPSFPDEANARPVVLRDGDRYRMWYCFRGSVGYRTNPETSYRIGYAESRDGVRWTRLDDRVGIERSADGWDSVMMEYPWVYEHRGRKHMLYNGNGFGETGIGFALLDEDSR